MDSAFNRSAFEALCSAAYVDAYIDCNESLPNDIQLRLSEIRSLDVDQQDVIRKLEQLRETYENVSESNISRQTYFNQIQQLLIRSAEIGDEKLSIVGDILEIIDSTSRQLDQRLENIDSQKFYREMESFTKPQRRKRDESLSSRCSSVTGRTTTDSEKKCRKSEDESVKKSKKPDTPKQKKSELSKRVSSGSLETPTSLKAKKQKVSSAEDSTKRKRKPTKRHRGMTFDVAIDPDEPTYCICSQVSYGEMVCCDNEDCQTEWFHFHCVDLTSKPKGKWFCPECRLGDKTSVINPALK